MWLFPVKPFLPYFILYPTSFHKSRQVEHPQYFDFLPASYLSSKSVQ
jgi:hypothetical protein